MRTGEAAALMWSDIDYKQNVIHITKTVTYDEDGTMSLGSPKSEAGKRDIPLNDTIKGALTSHRKKMGNILPMNDNRVFVSVYGGTVHNHAVNRAISGALARLEKQGKPLEHFTAHALRDTFATRYIEQGGSPQTLKTILGHSSLAMTMDRSIQPCIAEHQTKGNGQFENSVIAGRGGIVTALFATPIIPQFLPRFCGV